MIASRNRTSLEALAAQERSAGRIVEIDEVDITTEASVAGLRDRVLARHGRVDGIVFNAVSRPMRHEQDDRLLALGRRPRDIRTVAPFTSLRDLGRRLLHDPRLVTLLDRYATYTGSDPRRAPAALATVPYVEQVFGAWHLGGGIRSLNVALRQELDLYVCLRPVRYFQGMDTPVKRPDLVDMVIFRENTEDIYAGIEFREGSEEVEQFKKVFAESFPKLFKKIRFPGTSGLGIKPISREGSERLIRAAIQYAIDNKRKSLTLVHKGNIMKFTEGAFRDWGYELAKREFGAVEFDGGPWCKLPNGLIIKDAIADAFLQQILTRPAEYDVIATPNLNGDYISDALAAQVGGIGIAPGGNINYATGHAVFEATHGTAPKYANLDKVNPGSVILSGEMMFRYMGWAEAADLIITSLEKTIADKTVTYDLARMIPGSKELKCSEFGDAMIANM